MQGSYSDWKNGKAFDRGKSANFKQIEKVRENHTKYWKISEFQTNAISYFFSNI